MGAELVDRRIVVTVDTLRVTGLRMTFDIKKNLRKQPNTAALTIYNLNEEHRKALQQKLAHVTIEAGYRENIAQIYKGTMRKVMSTKPDGTTWATVLEAGDGEAPRSPRVNKSFRRADFKQAVTAVADDLTAGLGVGKGNLDEALAASAFVRAWAPRPVVLSGLAIEVFDRFMSTAGLEWSLQDGQLQVLEVGKPFGASAVLLTSSSGLVGSPEIGEVSTGKTKSGTKAKKHSVVKARSLLQPELVPGRRVDLRSRHVTGLFRVESAHLTGDTHGQDWYVDMELRPA